MNEKSIEQLNNQHIQGAYKIGMNTILVDILTKFYKNKLK